MGLDLERVQPRLFLTQRKEDKMICAVCGIEHDPKHIEFEDEIPICHCCIILRDEEEIFMMEEIFNSMEEAA